MLNTKPNSKGPITETQDYTYTFSNTCLKMKDKGTTAIHRLFTAAVSFQTQSDDDFWVFRTIKLT